MYGKFSTWENALKHYIKSIHKEIGEMVLKVYFYISGNEICHYRRRPCLLKVVFSMMHINMQHTIISCKCLTMCIQSRYVSRVCSSAHARNISNVVGEDSSFQHKVHIDFIILNMKWTLFHFFSHISCFPLPQVDWNCEMEWCLFNFIDFVLLILKILMNFARFIESLAQNRGIYVRIWIKQILNITLE